MRPIWVDPSTTVLPAFPGSQAFTPLICLSASKQITDGLERRKNGFTYVQGSGDDHELWGRCAILLSHETSSNSQHRLRGLTPDLFWSFWSIFLATSGNDLESVIYRLISSQASKEGVPTGFAGTYALKPVHAVQGRLLSVVTSGLPDPLPFLPPAALNRIPRCLAYVLITPFSQHLVGGDGDLTGQNILRITLPAAMSSHSHFLLCNILPMAIPFIRKHLSIGEDVCVACPTGKDLGPGVIVSALSLFFDDNGVLLCDDEMGNKGDSV